MEISSKCYVAEVKDSSVITGTVGQSWCVELGFDQHEICLKDHNSSWNCQRRYLHKDKVIFLCCFFNHTASLVKWLSPVSFMYFAAANSTLAWLCWHRHMWALEGLGLTADFYPTLSLWRGNKQDRGKYQEGQRTAKCKEAMEASEDCPPNQGGSRNVIPIPIETPLWSYERSQTVLLSSLSLVLWLNY